METEEKNKKDGNSKKKGTEAKTRMLINRNLCLSNLTQLTDHMYSP